VLVYYKYGKRDYSASHIYTLATAAPVSVQAIWNVVAPTFCITPVTKTFAAVSTRTANVVEVAAACVVVIAAVL